MGAANAHVDDGFEQELLSVGNKHTLQRLLLGVHAGAQGIAAWHSLGP